MLALETKFWMHPRRFSSTRRRRKDDDQAAIYLDTLVAERRIRWELPLWIPGLSRAWSHPLLLNSPRLQHSCLGCCSRRRPKSDSRGNRKKVPPSNQPSPAQKHAVEVLHGERERERATVVCENVFYIPNITISQDNGHPSNSMKLNS